MAEPQLERLESQTLQLVPPVNQFFQVLEERDTVALAQL